MANIHFIGGEKGGVGKSLVSRVIAQYFIDRGQPFLGFDTDRSHSTLLRFYADYASPIVVDQYEGLDQIVEAAYEQRERRILVDLAAQTHAPLVRWMDDSGVLEMAGEEGLTLTYWHVMDSGRDSVDLLKKVLDRFGSRLNYIIVLNQLRGENFEILEKSGEKDHALSLHARFLDVRQVDTRAINKMDGANTSFWAATSRTSADDAGLTIMERQRVRLWLNHVYMQLDALHL